MNDHISETPLRGRFVAGCVLRDAQRATITSTRATSNATTSATTPVKSLALQVIERNNRRNKGATDGVAPPCLSSPENGAKVAPVLELEKQRNIYRFRLHDGEGGGSYLTDAQTLGVARGELLQQYGDRLAMVVKA